MRVKRAPSELLIHYNWKRRKIMRRLILCAALLSAAALMSGNVHAQTVESAQREVSAKGVNFEDVRQVRFFYAKLTWAAHDVCTSEMSDPMTQMADKACQDDAVYGAVSQVNQPLLDSVSKRPRVELIARNTAAGVHAKPMLVVSGLNQ
jgi:UrcA family protein